MTPLAPGAAIPGVDPLAPIECPELPSVVETIVSAARVRPGAPAIAQGDRVTTYDALLTRADEVRRVLLDTGVSPGSVVAIGGRGKSPGLIAAMLGTLAARGVLLMIDPELPAERSVTTARLAAARHVFWVGRRGLPAWARELPHTVLDASDAPPDSGVGLAAAWRTPPAKRDPAYVFFTSGSTGAPKGVLGAHHGLAHFMAWQRTTFAARPGDRCAALTRVSFDVMLRDVFLPLTSGACLLLPEETDERPDRVAAWLARSEATWVHLVPSLARVWMDGTPAGTTLPRLRASFFAGEPLPDTIVGAWRAIAPNSVIANLYGPTETTLAKFCAVIGPEPEPGTQPVGFALPNTQALVLTDDGQPCAAGELGEIVIRTPFQTLGYVASATDAAAASRFRPNPFSGDPNDIVYYTGDLGRHRSDGQLEVRGRVDDQIKLHGVRIEPAEIERALIAACGLRDAVVTLADGPSGQPRLAAYVVAGARTPTPTQMRAELGELLPRAMVPSAFMYIDAVPLNANGKRNRRALPPIVPRGAADVCADPIGRVIGGDREARIAHIWRAALGRDDIGATDDVFTLGATSVAALAVAARVSVELGRDVPPGMIMDRPTPRGQAQWIDEVEQYDSRHIAHAGILYGGERRRVAFAFPPLLGYGLAFRGLAAHLTGHSLFSFDLPDDGDPVARFAAAVRDLDPRDPYTFIGYSAGGNLAFEVAVALEAQGAQVGQIIMLDSKRRESIEPMTESAMDALVWGNIENLAGLMRESDEFRDFARNEYLMERMAVKMRAYLRYETTMVNSGRTRADIHFVHSDDREPSTAWRSATSGQFIVYRGSGRHIEMTLGDNAERNGRLVDRILAGSASLLPGDIDS